MDIESSLSDEDFQAIHALLWEKPADAVARDVLERLAARRYVRQDKDGWFVTYAGHVQFLMRRAEMC